MTQNSHSMEAAKSQPVGNRLRLARADPQAALLLHEPGEKRFYRYEESSGLWAAQSKASLAQLVCDTVHAEAKGRIFISKAVIKTGTTGR